MSDEEAISDADFHKALFMNLVMSLASSAMQSLGKVVSPATGKAEVDLEAAQSTIDMLEMVEAKTRGNRDSDEERLLRNAISALQLNFVETAQSAGAGQPAAEPPAAGAPPPSDGADEKPKREDDDKTRFRKSYG